MQLLTFSELSRRLGLSPKTLRKMADQLPGRVLINGRPRYCEDAVMAFIQAGGKTETIRND
jgi:DNA-binding Lrp family transcriptional regulator